jgi:uncharacterized protein YndB with AHSA1/START domain
MLKKILLGLLAVIALLAIVVQMQPDSYNVTRTATIGAPPERVFPLVNDFRQWDRWSPWAKLDPNAKMIYSGAPSGVGAINEWDGNGEAGAGRMTIRESIPNEKIGIDLEFTRPFESKSLTEFQFRPGGAGTEVVWTMSGENNFLGKAFCLAMGGMDKAIGPDFEKGLAQMKSAVESGS